MHHREGGDLDFLKLLATAVQAQRPMAVLLLTASAGAQHRVPVACSFRLIG